MSPAIRTGSIIVAIPVTPSTLKIGDVITFKLTGIPQSESITHRIVDIKGNGSSLTFTTKGDANPVPDGWQVTPQGTAGKVILSVPIAGYILHAVGSPKGHVVFLAVPAAALTLMWLWEIWKPRHKVERVDVELPKAMAPAPAVPSMLASAQVDVDMSPDSAATLPSRQ